MVRRHPLPATGFSVIIVALLTLAACSSGSSKPTAKPKSHTASTTRPRHASSTTSSAPGGTSTPHNPSTTDPTFVTSTTAPPTTPGSCGPRADAIYAAIQGGDLGPVPLAKYAISDCRIAASIQIWSAVTLVPNPGSGVVQLTVVLQRIGSIWMVQAYGPSHVSCSAPPPVPIELHLGC